MKNPSDFYKSQIVAHAATLKIIKRKLAISSTIRLLVFILACIAIYFALENFKNEATVVIAIVLTTIVLFVFLVTRHNRLKYERDLTNTLIAENETELEVLDRNFHDLPSGEKYSDPRSEEHTSELQSRPHLVCRLLL